MTTEQKTAVRRTLLAAGVLAAVAAAFALAGWLPRYLYRAHYVGTRNQANNWCAEVPLAPDVTPETMGDAMLWPYRAVTSCRELAASAHLFGDVAASSFLLLHTRRGAVLVRVDYTNIDRGRQYVAAAVELAPDQASGLLSAADARRVNAGIATRDGVERTPWILHYGDG